MTELYNCLIGIGIFANGKKEPLRHCLGKNTVAERKNVSKGIPDRIPNPRYNHHNLQCSRKILHQKGKQHIIPPDCL